MSWFINTAKYIEGAVFLAIQWKATTPLEQTCQKVGENWSATDWTRLFLNEKCAAHVYLSWDFAIIM